MRTGKKFETLADVGEFEVMTGDVVVIGTDGLLDNLFSSEVGPILKEQVSSYGTSTSKSEKIASNITASAYANSRDKDYTSPLTLAAAKSVGKKHVGVNLMILVSLLH